MKKVQQAKRQLGRLPDTLFAFSGELHFRFTKELLQVTSPPVGVFWTPISFTMTLSATQETVGFNHVDAHVTDVMITWIGSVMQKTCHELVEEAREVKVSNRVATSNIEDLSDGSQVGVFWLAEREMFLFQMPALLVLKVEFGSPTFLRENSSSCRLAVFQPLE